jgi:hypothetical protein
VVAHQEGREVGRRSLPWSVGPGRVFRVPWSLLEKADPHGDDITVGLL